MVLPMTEPYLFKYKMRFFMPCPENYQESSVMSVLRCACNVTPQWLYILGTKRHKTLQSIRTTV